MTHRKLSQNSDRPKSNNNNNSNNKSVQIGLDFGFMHISCLKYQTFH